MIQYIFDKLFHIVHQSVLIKNEIVRIIGPVMDDLYCTSRNVILPSVSENNSCFVEFTLLPHNTKLHYYFKYSSDYDYNKVMHYLHGVDVIWTTRGKLNLIEQDEDVVVDLK